MTLHNTSLQALANEVVAASLDDVSAPMKSDQEKSLLPLQFGWFVQQPDVEEHQMALLTLKQMFDERLLQGVQACLSQASALDDLNIGPSTARSILSVVKWLDLAEPKLHPSTFPIRLRCLQRSQGMICSVDAMSISTAPELLAYEDAFQIGGRELNAKIEYQTRFIDEWVVSQRESLEQMLQAAKELSKRLDEKHPTRILLRGSSGAGKTYQSLHHPFLKGAVISSGPLSGVQNSDFYKELIQERYNLLGIQTHREGVALRTVLENAVNELMPELTIVKDVWLHKIAGVERELARASDMRIGLRIVDLDAPLLTCCLRIIERLQRHPYSAVPPYQIIATTFRQIREAREFLIGRIRQEVECSVDYQLLVSRSGGSRLVAEAKEGSFKVLPGQQSLFEDSVDLTEVDMTASLVAAHVINELDVIEFGPGLSPYVGEPVAQTLEKLSKVVGLR